MSYQTVKQEQLELKTWKSAKRVNTVSLKLVRESSILYKELIQLIIGILVIFKKKSGGVQSKLDFPSEYK